MRILLKLEYVKFGVPNLCFQKYIEEKPLGGSRLDPLVKEGLNMP